jgi:hypothetical protein
MTPDERLTALSAAGLTIAEVHRRYGQGTYHHFRYVVLGERRSPKIEQAVADALGQPVTKVFPPRESMAARAA